MPLTIFLADDHQIVRHGLRAILAKEPGFEIVGEAAEALETIRQVARLKPAVLVLDLMMPGVNGLEVTRQVRHSCPNTRVVILSMHSNEAYVIEAVRAGATGYVLKEAGGADLVKAIRQAAQGERYFSPPICERDIDLLVRSAATEPLDQAQTLTTREREVLQLSAAGHSGKEIAERLFISPRAVETHRMNVMRKLGVRNLKELIRFALENGLVLKNG
jgi:DNA-binding NarL/FixJ family response regulator